MGKLNGISVAQHIVLGKEISKVVETLMRTSIFVANNYGKTTRAVKRLDSARKHLDSFRSELDSDYHRQITDEQFSKHGHVYYKAGVAETNEEGGDHAIRQQTKTL